MKAVSVIRAIVPYLGLVIALLVLIAIFGWQSEHFFQKSTAVSIANQLPELTFLAVGMTLILIIGGIDLSVGSVMALASAVLGVLMKEYEWSIFTALPVALLVAGFCGSLNGLVSIGFGIPSFIVTLGMLQIARGTTKVVTDNQTVFVGRNVEWFGQPLASLSVSPAFLLALMAVVVFQFVLVQTVFGRYCVAIGTNREAVRMAGIPTARYAVLVFVISGCLCGLAGFARTSRMSTVDPNTGVGIELYAIAACVVGGTSLMGGRGSVVATFLGVLIIQVLQTGLAQIGVDDAHKQIITGAVIIAAVLLDAFRRR